MLSITYRRRSTRRHCGRRTGSKPSPSWTNLDCSDFSIGQIGRGIRLYLQASDVPVPSCQRPPLRFKLRNDVVLRRPARTSRLQRVCMRENQLYQYQVNLEPPHDRRRRPAQVMAMPVAGSGGLLQSLSRPAPDSSGRLGKQDLRSRLHSGADGASRLAGQGAGGLGPRLTPWCFYFRLKPSPGLQVDVLPFHRQAFRPAGRRSEAATERPGAGRRDHRAQLRIAF